MIRKFLVLIVLSISLLFMLGMVKYEVGDVIGQALPTDIKTYINGHKIPSLNVENHTVIAVEDLRNYGFNVIWNPTNKEVIVEGQVMKDIEPMTIEYVPTSVLYTDIKAVVNGEYVESFNIGNKTVIKINDLKAFGTVTWNGETREVHFKVESLKQERYSYDMVVEEIDNTIIEITYSEGKYYMEDKPVGYSQNIAWLSVNELTKHLGFERNKGIYYKDGYALSFEEGSKAVQTYYNGQSMQKIQLTYEPVFKDQDIYLTDFDLAKILGMEKSWIKETNTIIFNFSEYDIQDFGTYKVEGYNIFLNVKSKYDIEINIENYDDAEAMTKRSYTEGEVDIFNESMIRLNKDRCDLKFTIRNQGRILYANIRENVTADVTTHKLKTGRIHRFTYLEIEKPMAGYIETKDGKVQVKGTVNGIDNIKVIVTKDKMKVKEEEYQIQEKIFDFEIFVGDEQGTYNVQVYDDIKLFEFYVNKQ